MLSHMVKTLYTMSETKLQISPMGLILLFNSLLSDLPEVKNHMVDTFDTFYYLPGLNHESYTLQGDINIGALASATTHATAYQCSKNMTLDTSWGIQYIEAIAFAVRAINNDSELLPNLTLGFQILDDCRNDNIALAQSLSFLSREESQCVSEETCNNVSSKNVSFTSNTIRHEKPYDVVGILGPFASSRSVGVSSLYAVAEIPIVSYMASSDDLSDKSLHPYFLRLIPPDKHQVLAILKFIAKNGWSYISVVYELGSYGENAFNTIKNHAHEYGICIATSHRSNYQSDFEATVLDLLKYPTARVVILFVYIESAAGILRASANFVSTGHFVWIGSDAWADKVFSQRDLTEQALGSFVVMFQSQAVPGLYEHFKNLKINSTSNPWIRSYWEMAGECSFVDKTCNLSIGMADIKGFDFIPATSSAVDSVYTYAHAIQRLLKDKCPGVSKEDARNCVTGDALLSYLLGTSMQGYGGNIKFDINGDLIGRYHIKQFSYQSESAGNDTLRSNKTFQANTIAEYDAGGGEITYTGYPISWEYFRIGTYFDLTLSSTDNLIIDIPESFCSKPCVKGEYMIQKEPECCWECRRCRDNERLIHNDSQCEECDIFTWPDKETNFKTCIPIPLAYESIFSPISLTQVVLGTIGLIAIALIIAGHVLFKDTQVIKESSPKLTYIQIGAISIGYITVILFQATPSHKLCSSLYFLFCLSFSSLYSTLLLRTVQLYGIFERNSNLNRRCAFVSLRTQLLMALVLILFQIALCLAMYVIYKPTARTNQPVLTENYVEIFCDMTFPGLASFLTYNLVLVSLCSVFAFMTRKLHDNFNESRFISMCVSITLVIWLAFIFTYFILNKNSVRTLLLSLVLLLNHSVALIFLFAPKMFTALIDSNFQSTSDPKPGTSAAVLAPPMTDNNSTEL